MSALTTLRTLFLDDVLKQPLSVSYQDANVQLDATISASLFHNLDKGSIEINGYDFQEIYMRVPGLFDELVKLDLKSFCIHQKGLYETFCKSVEREIMKRAIEADDADWSYIHEKT